MLRLGLTRSLNSKKSSPNRVCCNALLAAYARATPPRWRQVGSGVDGASRGWVRTFRGQVDGPARAGVTACGSKQGPAFVLVSSI